MMLMAKKLLCPLCLFLVASKRDISELKVPFILCLLMMSQYFEVCNNADPLPNFVRIYIAPVKKKGAFGR